MQRERLLFTASDMKVVADAYKHVTFILTKGLVFEMLNYIHTVSALLTHLRPLCVVMPGHLP